MALDVANAPGAMTGARFRASLRDGRRVFLDGKQVDVTEHPAFAGPLGELCRMYDQQHAAENQDVMTFVSPRTGRRLSVNYLLPTDREGLSRRRANAEKWAFDTWGLLATTPEFAASALVGLYDVRTALAAKDPMWGANAEAYYHYAAEHDLFVAHAVPEPQAQRSELYPGQEIRAGSDLQVVEERADGIVVRGALPFATLAPLANELFVFYRSRRRQEENPQAVQWFATPLNAPGISMLCNEPRTPHTGSNGHPLAARYAEVDTVVFFDNVFVPRERVFLLGEAALAQQSAEVVKCWLSWSALIRHYYRWWTLIGITTMLAEAQGADLFRNMRDKLGELVVIAEVFKTALGGVEVEATTTPGGLFRPGSPLPCAIFAQQYNARVLDLCKDIAGGNILLQPSEADLANEELRPMLEEFMASRNLPAPETARLFRLAWDLIGDGTGVRRDVYERWLLGDVVVNKNQMFLQYDNSRTAARIKEMISKPLPIGEAPPVWTLMDYERN